MSLFWHAGMGLLWRTSMDREEQPLARSADPPRPPENVDADLPRDPGLTFLLSDLNAPDPNAPPAPDLVEKTI